MKYRLVADSSANIFEMEGVDFAYAPLKIVVGDNTFTDNKELNMMEMIENIKAHQGPIHTSCPNVSDWLDAFGDAEEIYCVTITRNLSGSYNAAVLAKNQYEEEHPEAKVAVLDTLSCGGELELVLEKIKEAKEAGKSFEEVCQMADEYMKTTRLLFCLESMDNLAKNGRISPLVAKAAGVLGIRALGRASDEGTIEQVAKCRGEKKTIAAAYKEMKERGYQGGKVRIDHVFNEGFADALIAVIQKEYPDADIVKGECGALCSFYAENGGMLVGYEG